MALWFIEMVLHGNGFFSFSTCRQWLQWMLGCISVAYTNFQRELNFCEEEMKHWAKQSKRNWIVEASFPSIYLLLLHVYEIRIWTIFLLNQIESFPFGGPVSSWNNWDSNESVSDCMDESRQRSKGERERVYWTAECWFNDKNAHFPRPTDGISMHFILAHVRTMRIRQKVTRQISNDWFAFSAWFGPQWQQWNREEITRVNLSFKLQCAYCVRVFV